MLADAWHYYWFAPLKAYRSYKEILATHGEDEGVKARCLVEMAACMLELARMPDKEWRADMEDARRACKRVMAEVPAEFDRAQAVADLMYCETFLYEVPSRWQESLDAFAGFEERHPGRTREISMALNMRAYNHADLGDWPSAKANWERILAMDISDPRERFQWKGELNNVKQVAALLWNSSV